MTNLPPYLEGSANLVYAAPFYFKVKLLIEKKRM